jgi:hypothetical protein
VTAVDLGPGRRATRPRRTPPRGTDHGSGGRVGIVGGGRGGEVGLEQRHRLGGVAGVDDAHGGGGREFGPVSSYFGGCRTSSAKRRVGENFI